MTIQHIERGQSGGHGQAALAEGRTVDHRPLHGGKDLLMNPFFAQHRADRYVTARKCFGQNHDVRVHVRAVVFEGQKFSGATHA